MTPKGRFLVVRERAGHQEADDEDPACNHARIQRTQRYEVEGQCLDYDFENDDYHDRQRCFDGDAPALHTALGTRLKKPDAT